MRKPYQGFQSAFSRRTAIAVKDNNPYYSAVRSNPDGAVYLDTTTLSGALDRVRQLVQQDTRKRMPCVGIVRVTITPIQGEEYPYA